MDFIYVKFIYLSSSESTALVLIDTCIIILLITNVNTPFLPVVGMKTLEA